MMVVLALLLLHGPAAAASQQAAANCTPGLTGPLCCSLNGVVTAAGGCACDAVRTN